MLRERRLALILVTLTFGGVAAYFEIRAGSSYDASATIKVDTGRPESGLVGAPRPKVTEKPAALTARLRSVALEPRVQRDAGRQLRRKGYDEVTGDISVALGNGVIRVIVRSNTPQKAADAANALASAVERQIERDEARRIGEQIATIRSTQPTRREARRDFFDFLTRVSIQASIVRLKVLQESELAARIIHPATPPDLPVSRRALLTSGVGTLGFSLAAIVVLLLDVFDRRPRDPRRLSRGASLPVAGLVPRLRRGEAAPEAFGQLLVAVESVTVDGPRVVAITSGAPAEGKTTIALGLAEAAARLGLKACVVEGDLRRPVLERSLDIEGPGLAGVLLGGPLDASLREVKVDDDSGAPPVTVAVLPAGPLTSRPGDVLRPEVVVDMIEALRGRFDLVLLDTPPLPVGIESKLLTQHADFVLLCARAGRTALDDLQAAADALNGSGLPPVALVVGAVPDAVPAIAERKSPARRRGLRRLVPVARRT